MSYKKFSPPSNTPVTFIPEDYCPDNSYHWHTLQSGYDAGKQLFYYDYICGQSNTKADKTLLFVHGNPESSYTYRKVIQQLQQDTQQSYRIIAMDHIGFGLSDQADFEMVDMHHAHNLLELVRHLDLQDITLIVHDWGGPIGIGALIQEPERISGLVVLNTTVFPIPRDGVTFENYPMSWLPWSRFPDWVPDRLWGNHSAFAVTATPKKPLELAFNYTLYHGQRLLNIVPQHDRAAHRFFSEQFASRINARSSKRMVRQTPVWGHGYRYRDSHHGVQDNRDFYYRIQQDIHRVWGPQGQNIPVRGLFGEWDPLAKDTVLAQWKKNLPQLEGHLQCFKDTSHFIEEHQAPAIAEAIASMP